MTPLDRSILETVVYFDLFDYPLTLPELYRYLWRPPANVTLLAVEQAVAHLPQLHSTAGVIVLAGRSGLGEVREQRYLESERKFRKRYWYLWLLSGLPGVAAIWIVNTMAYHNVRPESDIDLLIVAQPGKIWSTRFFTTLVAKWLGLRPTPSRTKDALCLSFYLTSTTLDVTALTQPYERYEAYWLAAIMPVYDPKNLLKKSWEANPWVQRNLPHAQPLPLHYNRSIRHAWWQRVGHVIGRLLLWESVWRWVQLRLLPKHLRALSGPATTAVVVLSDELLKFHTYDPRPQLMERFSQRLEEIAKMD